MRASSGPSAKRIECSTEDHARGQSLDTAIAHTRESIPTCRVCAPACAHRSLRPALGDLVGLLLLGDRQADAREDLGLGNLVEGDELGDGVLEAVPARGDAAGEASLDS